jgi:hypothetical protein
MDSKSRKIIITKENLELGDYCLSIEMHPDQLYLHEMLGGGWALAEGLWLRRSFYPAFREAYLSLKDQHTGIVCIQRDQHQQFPDGTSYLYVRRWYLLRLEEFWEIYEVGPISLDKIMLKKSEMDKIICEYDHYLHALEEKSGGNATF